jgi:hypothetical protein
MSHTLFSMVLTGLLSAGCPASTTKVKESTMSVQAIQATATVKSARIKEARDLELRVVVTNTSPQEIQLSTLFFGFTVIMLQVRRADGTPVHSGPPPMPPIDDGQKARIKLPPGGSATFTYLGRDFFAQDISRGDYEVRFQYENQIAEHGDWTGVVESEWVPFHVTR